MAVALLCVSATEIQSQTPETTSFFSGSVVVILDGFTVITLNEHQCKSGLSDKHQLLVTDHHGYPLLSKSFEGNTLLLNSAEQGWKTQELTFVLSSGTCTTSSGIVE